MDSKSFNPPSFFIEHESQEEKFFLVREKVKVLIEELNNKVIDREEFVKLVVLSLMSRKNMFVIGKPGVGKTFVIEKLKYLFEDEKVFEILFSHDTKKEELFGRSYVDENNEVHHDINNSVLDSSLLILDELFKSRSELLNSLLGVLSQSRNVFLQGIGEVKLKLLCAFAMSNEFPTDEALAPFDDRLNFRYEVLRLSTDKDFEDMITYNYDRTNDFSVSFTYDEIVSLQDEYLKIHVSKPILNFFTILKNKIIQNDLNISDRKLTDAVDIFRASAWLNGRDYVDYSDLFLLMHIGWKDFLERRKLKEIIFETFFEKDIELKKNLIFIKEEYGKIKSYSNQNVDPFIEDKLLFDLEDYDDRVKYNVYVDMYLLILESLENSVKRNLNLIADQYAFVNDVEDMIENNIFVIDYKNSSFSEDFLLEYYEFNSMFTEVYNYYFSFAETKGIKLNVDIKD